MSPQLAAVYSSPLMHLLEDDSALLDYIVVHPRHTEAQIRPQADGSVNVEGTMTIRDLNRAMGWELPDEAATTIAGLVMHEAQMIPEIGQAFTFHGYRFEVVRKQRNRVTGVRVRKVQPPAGTGAADGSPA